jgi:hypothetical protein
MLSYARDHNSSKTARFSLRNRFALAGRLRSIAVLSMLPGRPASRERDTRLLA